MLYGLLERIRTRPAAELTLLLGQLEMRQLRTYTRGFVHVDPSAVDINTSLGVVEELELIIPISVYKKRRGE